MMIRLSVLVAPETLMRWRVLCDSGQVTSQVTRKSFAHQHSFAVLACATFFETFFVLCTYSCVHIFSLYYCRCCCFSFISLSTCQSLIYVRHSSAFFFLVVCLCVAGWCQLQFSLSLARPASCWFILSEKPWQSTFYFFFCFFFIFKRISMTAP